MFTDLLGSESFAESGAVGIYSKKAALHRPGPKEDTTTEQPTKGHHGETPTRTMFYGEFLRESNRKPPDEIDSLAIRIVNGSNGVRFNVMMLNDSNSNRTLLHRSRSAVVSAFDFQIAMQPIKTPIRRVANPSTEGWVSLT